MSQKKTVEHYSDLAKQRNHDLIRVTNKLTPSQGNLMIFCKSCNSDFETSAKSYENAKASGCPNCKAIKARNQPSNPKPKLNQQNTQNTATNEAAVQKVQQRLEQKLVKRAEIQKLKIYTRAELLLYLEKNKNVYSDFIIQKLSEPTQQQAVQLQQTSVNSSKENIEVHHIFPRHAGGPDTEWNRMFLTQEDHIKAHELRYQVYKEFGDYNFLLTRDSTVRSRIEPNPEFDAMLRKQRVNANANARPVFSDDDGSKASKAVLSGLSPEAQKTLRLRHRNKMSEQVRNVLQNGATFYHDRTKKTFVLEPDQAPTLTELKDLLASVLPAGDLDRKRLENTLKPVNVTSAIAKMIKGAADRPSAYGWKLVQTN